MDVIFRPILGQRTRWPAIDMDKVQADPLVAVLAATIDDAETVGSPVEEVAIPRIGDQRSRRRSPAVSISV